MMHNCHFIIMYSVGIYFPNNISNFEKIKKCILCDYIFVDQIHDDDYFSSIHIIIEYDNLIQLLSKLSTKYFIGYIKSLERIIYIDYFFYYDQYKISDNELIIKQLTKTRLRTI